MIKMIVCADIRGGIGFNNELLYNIPEDMQFFKEMTTGHKVVMGYYTWLSLPKKPLPNRDNYILYDNEGEEFIEESENVHLLSNLFQVVKLGVNDDIFIIGGAKVYNDMIENDLIDEAYITIVDDINYSADRFINLFELSKNLKHRELIKVINFKNYFKEDRAHIYKFTR